MPMKWLLGLILLASPMQGQSAVVISSTAIHQWTLLFREFETEFLLCLYGRAGNDSLSVEFGIPADIAPRHSLPGAIADGGHCLRSDLLTDGLHLVGFAHNHPRTRAQINGERFHTDPSEDLCYQSKPDFQSFADGGWPIAVVVCGMDRALVVLRPNQQYECRYDGELEVPVLTCARKS